MHKTTTKLLALGTAITLLLSFMLITGCTKTPEATDAPTTTEESVYGVGTFSDDWTQDTTQQPAVDDTTANTTTAPETTTGDTDATTGQTTDETTDQTQPDDGALSYAQYLAMTPDQQKEFYESFSSMDAWIAWIEAAKAAHQDSNADNTFTVGTDPIDLEELLGTEP